MAQKPTLTVSTSTVFSLLIAILGGALILTWFSLWTSTASVFTFKEGTTDSFHVSLIAFGVLSAIIRIIFALRGEQLRSAARNTKVVLVASLVTTACLPLVALSYTPEPIAFLAGVRLVGLCCAVIFGSVFLFTCWIDIISTYDKQFMMPIVAASFFLFSLLYFALIALPSPLLLAVSSSLPLMTFVCFIFARDRSQRDTPQEQLAVIKGMRGWGLLALLAVSAFFIGLIGQIVRALTWSEAVGAYPIFSSVYHELGILLSSIILCIYVAISRSKNWGNSKQILGLICLFVVAIGIVVPGILQGNYMPVADFALGIGLGCFQMQICYYSALLSQRTGLSSFTFFGILYTPLELAGSVGLLIMDTLIASSIIWNQIALVAIVILFLLTFIALQPFLKHQNLILPQSWVGSSEGDPDERAEDVDKNIATIKQAFSAFEFTPREEDVALLLLQGRSIPFIQNELNVSEGTAKTHLLHIYRKCGVHNRQEFINLFHS